MTDQELGSIIPLESLKALSSSELTVLMVDRLNRITTNMDVFVTGLNGKVGKEEFLARASKVDLDIEGVKEDHKKLSGRVYSLENKNENANVSEESVKVFKSRIWSLVLGFLAIMEFIFLVINSINSNGK